MFWTSYPIDNILKTYTNNKIFKSLIFNKSINNKFTYNIINYKVEYDKEIIKMIRIFLIKYFGSPPKTPIFDISEINLLKENDHILYTLDSNNEIIGCIRYHYLGKFITSNNEPIYCIDCFCIHPKWRKKGLGDYLLTSLHNYVNNNNINYSMFLKEGKYLSIIHQPFYSSIYVYKELNKIISNNVKSVSINEAYNLIKVFLKFNKNIFVILNENNKNQFWKLYKKDTHYILACIQDTYQTFRKNENDKIKKIGWITAWFESPNITDDIREKALNELADSIYTNFDYIWANKEWIGKSRIWKDDGPFHWYLYQWTSCIKLEKSYCILN